MEIKEIAQGVTVCSQIMHGQPCIRNTRVPVDVVIEKINAGYSSQDIFRAYPHLSPGDIANACLYHLKSNVLWFQ
jgi:uncharacterized protein (DUF433 family)